MDEDSGSEPSVPADPNKVVPPYKGIQGHQVKNYIQRLEAFGYSQSQIGQMVGVKFGRPLKQPTISKYVCKTRDRLVKELVQDRQQLAAQQVQALRQVRQTAYEAWIKTLEPYRKDVLTKEGLIVTLESTRTPAAEFLTIVLATYKQEAQLLGLDAPSKVDVKQAVVQLDWDRLLNPQSDVPTFDEAEDKIKAVLAMPPRVVQSTEETT